MRLRLVEFGVIEVDGVRYEHDVVLDAGVVRKRKKGPSKRYRGEYGHTPLSAAERLPWGRARLVIGTGAAGALPVLPDVESAAVARGVTLDVLPTEAACELLSRLDAGEANAILHVTC